MLERTCRKWKPSAHRQECHLVQTLRGFLKKLKTELPYDPEIPLLGIYPKNPKITVHKDKCIPMLTAALFTTAKTCKQPRCHQQANGLEDMVFKHTHNGILLGHKEEEIACCW